MAEIVKRRNYFPVFALTAALAFGSATGCQKGRTEVPPFFPAAKAPNYEGLVSAVWVKALIDFHQPNLQSPRTPTYRNNHFVILEASWANIDKAEDYRRGHIPGAIHLNTDELENGFPRWKLRPERELQPVIGQHGITPQTTVIVYGQQLVAAARVWWVLKYAGVADVRLLDGGFEMWEALGYPRETVLQTPVPVAFEARVNSNLLATTGYVRSNLESQRLWLADARSEAEFKGNKSGYQYLDCKGRIPTSIAIGNADDRSALYTRRDGRLRDPAEVDALWRERGMVATKQTGSFDREVIFYCGGGWRSSLAFFYAWLLGYQNVRNYSDGWSGWSTVYVPDPAVHGGTPRVAAAANGQSHHHRSEISVSIGQRNSWWVVLGSCWSGFSTGRPTFGVRPRAAHPNRNAVSADSETFRRQKRPCEWHHFSSPVVRACSHAMSLLLGDEIFRGM